jgi:predicted metal-dependent hydrolase
MSSPIPVRTVDLALSEQTPLYWYGGDPFKTHFMNALSATFPEGEAFFVRSVRHYRDRIDDPELLADIRGFSGQEAMHSRKHLEHVELLARQGYPWLLRLNELARREMRFYNRRMPLYSLATTAALEHLTAIIARGILSDPERWLGPMHSDIGPLWRWHAVEEAEHKSVAFEVLQRVSGSRAVRVFALIGATLGLFLDNFIRLFYLLRKDGLAWKPRVWLGGARWLWGRQGLLRALIPDYLEWYRRGFRPDQRDDQPLIDAGLSRLPQVRVARA